ncbi:tungsten cofactor oxidoreductase radical SAM maturase [Fusibacter paucivorans]|uniref:Tungsten cofactor oxidoreductase radical SAM maturase n=1 Tax=Fusibacter paucivorans TaxID=76009 RepID=A0ABS5PJN6_9FIRM|nr:tungsten cofactor oxidoreductase radical SAM maturase [Fusibacter paucivorans]MBS7525354.1 tungsten cofactor oxidoreductase radical SAM maturase [Fusibacter paucivorans]
MKKTRPSMDVSLFTSGKIVSGSICGKHADHTANDYLMVETMQDIRLIPLKPDVRKIYIEVTTDCNFNCVTCIRHSWTDSHCHMPWQTFESILESLVLLPELDTIHFGGFGEPMMHPHIFDMLKAVKNLGVKVEMISNGSYLTPDNIERLIALPLDTLFTSIDSPEADSYNDIRIGADFNNVTENVKAFQAAKHARKVTKPELGIEFVAMKQNFSQLPELIQMARKLEAAHIIVSNLLPYDASMTDEIVYDLEDKYVMFGKDSLKTTIFAQIANMKLRTERSCKFVDDHALCINHLGEISPCYALMHTYHCYIYGREKQITPCYIGNIADQTLPEIWMDPGYVNFRRTVQENKFPSCTDCKYQDGCTYTESNTMDCWGNSPSCADCLWARRIIACP